MTARAKTQIVGVVAFRFSVNFRLGSGSTFVHGARASAGGPASGQGTDRCASQQHGAHIRRRVGNDDDMASPAFFCRRGKSRGGRYDWCIVYIRVCVNL